MPPKVKQRWGTVHRKQPASVSLRIAQRLGVSIRTVDTWRHGHEPSRPQSRTAVMLEVCYAIGAFKEAEAILVPIEIAKAQIPIPEFTTELQAQAQYIDATEDQLEARFNERPSRETWLPWRRAMLEEIAHLHRLVCSGNVRYAG